MPRPIVYFDGACPLCLREIGLLSRLAGERLEYLDVAPEGAAASCPLPQETLLARFHVRDGAGAMTEGAEAFLVAWGAVPGLGFLRGLRRSRRCVRALDCAYDRFLRIRPRLQRFFR
jgi:predicted DCC family thiol-disulfide oxidoreductase YuxK